MSYCSSCGSELNGDEDYCPSCGESLGDGNEGSIVNVNVQQSAEQISKTEAEASTERAGSKSSSSSNGLSFFFGVALFGMAISYLVGYGHGLTWWEIVTVPPYSFPFWLFGAILLAIAFSAIRYQLS